MVILLENFGDLLMWFLGADYTRGYRKT